MRTENFKHGVISILLIFALAFSMISVAPLASSGDWVNEPEPGGTTIEVGQGGNFLIRHTLEWNEPEDGAYTVTMAWDCYNNREDENFTFVEASAYFTTGPNAGQSILAMIILDSAPSPDYPGGTRYALSVSCPADDKDPRNGQFNVDIFMSATGTGGIPHIATDNHPIIYHLGGIVIIEGSMNFWNRAPITIRVGSRGVGVSISPLEGNAEPGRTLMFTVTVTNTDNVLENYNLIVSDDAGWGATLAQSLLAIPAGENRTTTVSVTVPSDATEDELTQITVVARSQAVPAVSTSFRVTAKSLVSEGIPLAVLIAISAFFIVAAMVLIVYLLRVRPKKKEARLRVDQRWKL